MHSQPRELSEATDFLVEMVRLITGAEPVVAIRERGNGIALDLDLGQEAMRRATGRRGRNYEAIRRIAGAISGRLGTHIVVRIHDLTEGNLSQSSKEQ